MSITPVSGTGLESIATESGSDTPASGFDLLLADAAGDHAPDEAIEGTTRDHDTPDDAGNHEKSNKTPTDTAGLVAALMTPVPAPIPTWTAPPDGEATDTAVPMTDTGAPGSETAGTDATGADAPVIDPPPADVPDQVIDLAETLDTLLDSTPAAAAPEPDLAVLTDVLTDGLTDAVAATPRPAPAPQPSRSEPPKPAADSPEPANAPGTTTKNETGAAASENGEATTDHVRSATQSSAPDRSATVTVNSTGLGSGPPAAAARAAETSFAEHLATEPTPEPPAPAEQLVSVLKPLRATPNGTYTLHLELKPAELGRIEMRVDMKDGVMHASIHSEHEGSAQLLRDALHELRDRLEAANVRTGGLTVHDNGVGARNHDRANAQRQAADAQRADLANPTDTNGVATTTPPNELDPEGTSLLDVRV